MFLALVGVLLLSFGVWAVSPVKTLDIVDRNTRNLLLALPAAAGEPFTLTYLHSIARRPVEEVFYVTPEGQILVDKTVWDMNGAGLPAGPEPGMEFELEDGKYILSHMGRRYKEVVLAVGWVAQHKLVYRRRILPLARLTPPGQAVRLLAGVHPRWLVLYEKARWLGLSEDTVDKG